MRALRIFALAAVSTLGLAGFAWGDSIGVNFYSSTRYPNSGTLATADTAGYVPQTHWNNADSNGGQYGGGSESLAALADNNGNPTTANIIYSSNYAYFTNDGSADGDHTLFSRYLDGSATLTLTNIPYASYDVYLYAGQEGSTGATGYSATDGVTTLYFNNDAEPFPGYAISTATTPGAATNANTLMFAESSPTVTLSAGPGGIFGVQIVEVPEPASLSILGGATLLLAARRRRTVAV